MLTRQVFTTKEASQKLGFTVRQVRYFTQCGKLNASGIGSFRYSVADLREFLDGLNKGRIEVNVK